MRGEGRRKGGGRDASFQACFSLLEEGIPPMWFFVGGFFLKDLSLSLSLSLSLRVCVYVKGQYVEKAIHPSC